MNSLVIRPASEAELAQIALGYEGWLYEADVAETESGIVGFGGFARDGDMVWAVFGVKPEARPHGAAIVRALRRKLAAMSHAIYSLCEDESAERLHRVLGFGDTGLRRRDKRDGTMRKVMRWLK
jgi:hypothetical protein